MCNVVPINKSLAIIKFDFLAIKFQHVEKQCTVWISEPDILDSREPQSSTGVQKPSQSHLWDMFHYNPHTHCVSDTDPHTPSDCNNQITTCGLIHRLLKSAQTFQMGWTQHKERCDVGSCLHHWEHEGPLLKNVWFLLFFQPLLIIIVWKRYVRSKIQENQCRY